MEVAAPPAGSASPSKAIADSSATIHLAKPCTHIRRVFHYVEHSTIRNLWIRWVWDGRMNKRNMKTYAAVYHHNILKVCLFKTKRNNYDTIYRIENVKNIYQKMRLFFKKSVPGVQHT